MTDIEFKEELDKRYFARCAWVDEDLDDLTGIENLTSEQRKELKRRAQYCMEERMCEVGWETLQDVLDNMLREQTKQAGN
jgi:hypothetical protein